MARAYPQSDYADPERDAGAGEWQALRGELVALLDKVENRYSQAEPEPREPDMSGLAQRVRHLRDQMSGPETASRRQEALRTVKRAVDRFSLRDERATAEETADLSHAIAEIRSRQGAAPQMLRRIDSPEIRELNALVGGMSQRLERLESELKSQRSNEGHVREVAGQVEQLTQVVELLAGAIGETGQVKRLETQIAALAGLIEDAPAFNLDAINARLDDVSGTVGKLAELQAQQMEREVAREKKRSAGSKTEPVAKLAPAMHAIEESVRNVYDRIDSIERNVALSSGDFEKLTSEMAAFTRAMRDDANAPNVLVGRVEALAERLEDMDHGDGAVVALKADIAALRDAVLAGMEPRFSRLESQIAALSGRIDTGAVEDQLRALMGRMDDAGAQLDGLARLYASSEERTDFEALANMVAERTGEAVSRKAPAPVAMFGPESLKSIEDRLTGLIKSAGKTPDYDALAEMIATRASDVLAKSAAPMAHDDGMQAMEKRMTALLNTAGQDTAERLARLETMLSNRNAAEPEADVPAETNMPALPAEAERTSVAADAFGEAMRPRRKGNDKLDTILARLDKADAMPANPADEAPLVDPGFKAEAQPVPAVKTAPAPQPSTIAGPAATSEHRFDPSPAQKPPRPQSSLAPPEQDPFAGAPAAPAIAEPVAPVSSTSTFVAAARRAQRLRQEQVEPAAGNSVIGRALYRMRPRKDESKIADDSAAEPIPVPSAAEDKPVSRRKKPAPEAAPALPVEPTEGTDEAGFLTRHRRPLLLAATLVVVSMLALNLVLQRTNSANAPALAEASTAPQVPANNPEPSDDQSSIVPPRVIDLIDPTATGSINSGKPMSFSKAAVAPLPISGLMAEPAKADAGLTDAGAAPSTGDSSSDEPMASEAFELPPEAIGPLELREAAAKGNVQAQFEVAAIFSEGRQLEKDFAAAGKWYERAAAQGFAPAQYRLGNLYEVGTGVEKDLEQARLWYQRGAEAGNRMAMHNLAALYAGGQLGDQQFDLAAEWFEQAANFGMTDSQFNLGMLHARGLGVEQSFEQSFKWFALAARSGDKDAIQARDDIAKSLSADAVSRITGELETWTMEPVDLAANFAPIGAWSSQFDPGETIAERDITLKVQQSLARLGFDVGIPDGVAGPKTAEAIKSFERATGMSSSGRINPRLLAVLGSQPV
ncbi:peptidoglycan-binding protein [Devosia sp. YIM 151766]|uniref:peptidoglycan-binding protein n=1 Tax=Devosia sp. YIM 151766 TaxID=3017325 RepID=UPI00255CA316|nr:peptidoglycan-binding protein [Devosia sp. YIM 151766]WIY53300.1 peptidoglycan-binding protein [Devosia sp. YIM 151766]